MQRYVLQKILAQRTQQTTESLAALSEETAADFIYAIDAIADQAILDWFAANWPAKWPVEIIMEGLDESKPLIYPKEFTQSDTQYKCIIDPIDGTRGIMYDKRPAWILTGLAPQRGDNTCITDIFLSVMTEIPTTRQWRADQVSAITGKGVEAHAIEIRNEFQSQPIELSPSQADTVDHAFATIARYFPLGSTLLSEIEEALWREHMPNQTGDIPTIFNDHYISTGGQFYEMLAGHDRFLADLRPLVHKKLGIDSSLACHPYDICCARILLEAGCILETPQGQPIKAPLDTTTPVTWVAYANTKLAEKIRPSLIKVLIEKL